ncbi:MAG: hypothetical protein AABM31_03780 [Actinomycetota bacterium]
MGRRALAAQATAGPCGALGRSVPDRLPGPEALAELAAEAAQLRGSADGRFDLVVTNPAGTDPAPWIEAGATWCLTGFGPQPTAAGVRETIDAGP